MLKHVLPIKRSINRLLDFFSIDAEKTSFMIIYGLTKFQFFNDDGKELGNDGPKLILKIFEIFSS